MEQAGFGADAAAPCPTAPGGGLRARSLRPRRWCHDRAGRPSSPQRPPAGLSGHGTTQVSPIDQTACRPARGDGAVTALAALPRPRALPPRPAASAGRRLDVVLPAPRWPWPGSAPSWCRAPPGRWWASTPGAFLVRQLGFLCSGWWRSRWPPWSSPRRLRALAPLCWMVCLVLLAAVLTPVGTVVNGPGRGFYLGPVQLQPPRLAKVATIATWPPDFNAARGPFGLRHLPCACWWSGPRPVLILASRDLGSVLVFAAVALAMLLVAVPGPALRHPRGGGALGVGAAFATGAVEGYQRDRLTSFAADGGAGPGNEAGYNLDQPRPPSAPAGARDGAVPAPIPGRYVPEQQTGLHLHGGGGGLGFVGGASLLLLYALVCWRCGGQRGSHAGPSGAGLRRGAGHAAVPCVRERGHGDGDHAHHGHPPALRFVRRLLVGLHAGRRRPGAHVSRSAARP